MIEPRDYQFAAKNNVFAELDEKDACLVVLPTGTGKTVIGGMIAEEVAGQHHKTLILAHRWELLEQWANTCDAMGLSYVVEKAEQEGRRDTLFGRADVVLGSKDTMQGRRLERWPKNTFSHIVADECHRANQPTWLKIFSHFDRAKRIGLTATPNRTDDEDIQEIFGNCVYEKTLAQAINEKWLVPPFFYRPGCRVDLSKIGNSAGDLNQGDLEDEISEHVGDLVLSARQYLGDRSTMAFTPRVASAGAMADGFRQIGVTARYVHGDSEDRVETIRAFKGQEFQCLASCDLLREGADFPAVANLVFARPTKSGLVYRQMLGRGLRLHEGKTHCTVVDFAWLSGGHDLYDPMDLYDASTMDLDILRIASAILASGKQCDPREAIKEAERIHKEQVELRVQVRERTPKYKMVAYDPFQIGALLGVPNRQVRENSKPLTNYNAERLAKYKLETEGIVNVQAEALLKTLDQRRQENKASHRMLALLVSKGVPAEQARAMPFDDAKEDLDILVGNRA